MVHQSKGYPRVVAEKLLTQLDLWSRVDALVVADDVGFGRPYPYMIHHLMRQFSIADARRVSKVGDTARDMQEGKNAGCGLVIGISLVPIPIGFPDHGMPDACVTVRRAERGRWPGHLARGRCRCHLTKRCRYSGVHLREGTRQLGTNQNHSI